MIKISITKPCSENWNKMTPNEKGAFCNKCKLDVIDFSTKSELEIKSILQHSKKNKICGRLTQSQLNVLNHDYSIWTNQSKSTFQSKFIWACILSFGFTLFSACNTSITATKKIEGKEEISQSYTVIEKNCASENIVGSIKNVNHNLKMDYNQKDKTTLVDRFPVNFILGDIMYIESPEEENVDCNTEYTHIYTPPFMEKK